MALGTSPVMLHVALWQPEIPPNTGNIARLCAATGAALHLIGRLGFRLDDRSLRRAGLDYWDALGVQRHASYSGFEKMWVEGGGDLERLFAFSAKAGRIYTQVSYQENDGLLFGGETYGLPAEMVGRFGD